MDDKTNVMRVLELRKLPYHAYHYPSPTALSGTEVAALIQHDPAHVFKTLVTLGASKHVYVFVIPVAQELSLKKAAAAVHEKSIEMLKSKELLPLTGYIHGGCSPIGMKKAFPTVIDETAELFDTIVFSAGKLGCQVEMSLTHLVQIVPFTLADLTV
ncbi:MAG: Cys-tRNA(Pro) deacylase [Clostridia bacterium]